MQNTFVTGWDDEVRAMKQIQKTASFAVLHFLTAFSVAWVMTGSWLIGGAVALVEPAINTVVFFFHEKAWSLKSTEPATNGQAVEAITA